MLKVVLNLLLVAFPILVLAQQINGKVVDQRTGDPIAFVSIGILGSNEATISNENGEFVLKAKFFPVKLRFSHVSYLTTEVGINEPQENLKISLTQASFNLQQVTIGPDRGVKLLKAAFNKAKKNSSLTYYANAFYRQLINVNGEAKEINELFYDLRWSIKKIDRWKAKQSRYAELLDSNAFSINNQSFLTFLFSGIQLPEDQGKFVTLSTLNEFQISVEKYIDQADQQIAVIECTFRKPTRGLLYANTTYYIGTKDFNIYRIDNMIQNIPVDFPNIIFRFQPVMQVTATFKDTGHAIPTVEAVSSKLSFGVNMVKDVRNYEVNALLIAYQAAPELKNQRLDALNGMVIDKKIIQSIKYDPKFWKDNPIVKQTALEDAFIKMMESKSAFGTMINP